jgi:hypothetical protein
MGCCQLRAVNRNCDADFRPHTCLAPNLESRTDMFRPLAHAAKTPVRIALFLNGFRLDSAAVVTNEHAQEVAQVLDFNFYGCRFRMTQRVNDCFPEYQKELLLDWRVQLLRLSLNEDSKPYTLVGCDFRQKIRKGLLETGGRRWGHVKPPYSRAAFINGPSHQAQSAAEHGLRGGIGTRLFHRLVEQHGGTKKSLE